MCSRACVKVFGDLDVTFGYPTAAIVNVLMLQGYRKTGTVVGSSRLQIFAPDPLYRISNGCAPYCLGANATCAPPGYSFPSPGQYAYNGAVSSQQSCQYQDATQAVPGQLDTGGGFITTLVATTPQTISPDTPECATLGASYCTWVNTSGTTTAYVPDAEFFTVYIDHSFAASVLSTATTTSIRKSGYDMAGVLLGQPDSNNVRAVIDPCSPYAKRGLACPSYIGIGKQGTRDIVPLAALLEAGGLTSGSLDVIGGSSGGVSTSSIRASGGVVFVQISYTNYYLPAGSSPIGTSTLDPQTVVYSYQVLVGANTDFKGSSFVPLGDTYPSTNRTYVYTHGMRIDVVQAGWIGDFDAMSLLIQLTVSLGLLAAASLVVDSVALYLCPTRAVVAQYKTRTTGRFAVLRSVLDKDLKQKFKDDPYLVYEEFPPVVREAMAQLRTGSVPRAEAIAALPPSHWLRQRSAPSVGAVEPQAHTASPRSDWKDGIQLTEVVSGGVHNPSDGSELAGALYHRDRGSWQAASAGTGTGAARSGDAKVVRNPLAPS